MGDVPAYIANDSRLLDGWVFDLRYAPNDYSLPYIIDASSTIEG
ncbi:MAG: hypothetical protein ACLPPF_15785 [Rhodomicrobium sp.]